MVALLSLAAAAPARAAEAGLEYIDRIHTPAELDVRRTEPVVIAIVDDGVLNSHAWLREFVWTNPGEVSDNGKDDDGNGLVDDVHGWDWSDYDPDANPPSHREGYHHGSHVAGIIAAIARRALGEEAPRYIRIMPVKTLADEAERPILTRVYEGIDYAVDNGADIVLTAWGLAMLNQQEERVLDKLGERDVVLVAAAGNFPDERPQYPAAHPAAMSVSALDDNGVLAAKSNFGATVDLAAPGEGIVSAGVTSDDATLVLDGTSFSAAMVAAAAALVKLAHPDLTAEETRACLVSSARPLSAERRRYIARVGAGSLDIAAAVKCPVLMEGESGDVTRVAAKGYLRPGQKKGAGTDWLIEPPGEVKGLRFALAQPVDKRAGGTVSFYDLTADTDTPLESHPVQALPEEVYVPSNRARVRYQPRRREVAHDLLIRYSADLTDVRKLYCSGTTRISTPGILRDGSGDAEYSYDTDCKWLIIAPPGKKVHFRFTRLDTEMRRDLVYFFNGDGTFAPIMAIFSGQELPPELTTWGNVVLVWFVTDGQNQGQGWEAEVSFVDAE